MQRSGAATRRFYAAFYQWTVRSANPTRRCAGTTATLVPRRKQSTAHGARGNSRPQRHNESVGTTAQLRKEAVQSTAARPSGSLDLWEHAVRDKSEKSVTVELAVPRWVLRAEDVAKRAQVHEVRMSTPLLREDASEDETCTVLLEGDYSDVQAVWRNMYNTGSGQSTASKDPTPANLESMLSETQQSSALNHQDGVMEKDFSLPSPFWQPIGTKGVIEYFQTRLGLHADMLEVKGPHQYVRLKGSREKVLKADRFLERIRSQELLGIHHKNSSDAPEKQAGIVRYTDLASGDLRVWQYATRKRLEGQTEVDYCLPERAWQRIVQNGGAADFRTRFSVDVDPLETSGDGKKRCVSLKGDVAHVERAKGYLEGFKVNIPELQVDREYLRIYSAVTGLHTPEDAAHRETSPKVQEKVGDSEQTPQPAPGDVHEEFARMESDSSEPILPRAYGGPYKRLALDPPLEQEEPSQEEQPAPNRQTPNLRVGDRFAVPEHIRRELQVSDESTLQQIQKDSGLEALVRLPMAGSKQYLKMLGKLPARTKAQTLLQKSIDDDNKRTGQSNPGFNELALPLDATCVHPGLGHVAWILMPQDMPVVSTMQRNSIMLRTDTKIRSNPTVDGKQLLKIFGTTALVNLTVTELRAFMETQRKATGNAFGELEVLKTGLVAEIGSEPPLELSAEAVAPKGEAQVASVEGPKAPEKREPHTHFSWIKLPHADGIDNMESRRRRRGIADKHGSFIAPYKRVTATEGVLRLSGSEEDLANAVVDLQHWVDEVREKAGKSVAKIEVVQKGLKEDTPHSSAVQQLILEGKAATSTDQVSASVEKAAAPQAATLYTHFAWVILPNDDAMIKDTLGKFTRPAKRAFQRRNDCTLGDYSQATEAEGVMMLSGTEDTLRTALDDIQQLIDAYYKQSGKPAAKIEILEQGLRENAPHVKTVKQAILTRAAASSSDQAPVSVEEADAPQAATVHTHFAWLGVPGERGMEHVWARPQRQVIGNKTDCFVSRYNRVTETKGMVQLLGTEHAVKSGLEELQRLVDGRRERQGKSHVKLELLDMGLLGNMQEAQALKQSIREKAAASSNGQAPASVGEIATPKAEAPRAQWTHYAWMRLPSANGLAGKVRAVRGDITAKIGCKISNSFPAGQTEQVIRLLGDEKAISATLEAVQQVADNEAQKGSGRPADRAEIIEMGLRKDMVDFDTFRQSRQQITTEGAATPPEQPASLPQQASDEVKVEEQAKKAASSSSSDKTPKDQSVDVPRGQNATKAEVQPAQQSNQELGDGIRSALQHITQPVALVTSFMRDEQKGVPKHTLARGVTVSSFCTVTLHPVPVVSFNLRVPSRSWDAISASGYFGVHLLKASPEGAAAAHAFTLPYEQPHEPFESLDRSGAFTKYGTKTKSPAKVPRIKWAKAIHAHFVAKVLPEKCVTVGDHVIVVAEVTKVPDADEHALSDTGALAYGMKGYRQLGGEIKPMELKAAEQEPSKAKPASPEVVVEKVQSVQNVPIEAANITRQESAVDHIKSDDNLPNDIAQDDLIDVYERFSTELDDEEFEATPTPAPSSNSAEVALPGPEAGVSQQAESASKDIEDLGPSSPLLDEESLQQVLEEDEASYSAKGLPSKTAADNPMLAEALSAVAGAYDHTPAPAAPSQHEQKSETQARPSNQSTDSVTPETRPANVLSNGKRPWGIEGSMTHQIRKMSIYHNTPRRHYSTDSPPAPISKKLLKTTVSDYLAQVPTHRKRYTDLIKLHRHAERLEDQLQNSKTLSPEEATALSTEASTARRKVSRELALRNAHDLRAMLDKGRVAAERAQWLESCLEQGQAVLLDEAKLLRRKLEDGVLRLKDFEEAKAGLTRDYEFIDAQLMRLRDFADEDDVVEMEDEEEGVEGVEGEKERASG